MELSKQSSGLKILELAPVDLTVNNFLIPLIDSLKKEGFEVYIYSKDTGFGNKLIEKGYKFKNIPLYRGVNILFHLYSLFYLIYLIKKEKFKIVHTHTPITGIIGRLASYISRVPIIIHTSHGFPFEEKPLSLKEKIFIYIYITLERILSKITDKIFFISKEEMNFYIKNKIIDNNKCFYIGSVGVNIKIYNQNNVKKSKEEIKSMLNLPSNCVVLSFIGRLTYEKGIKELFEAFIKVSNIFKNVYLLIIGKSLEGDKKKFPVKTIENLKGKNKNIIYLGYLESILEILKITDILILPSYREGVPKVLLEAMAMEIPVISTNIRGVREIIKNGENGILIEPKNVDQLVDSIILLINDVELRKKLAKNAYNMVIKNHNENLIIQNQIKIILELIKNY